MNKQFDMTARDKGHVEEIINHLKRVENDYRIDLTSEIEWLRRMANEKSISEDLDKAAEQYAEKKLESVDPELAATKYNRHVKMKINVFCGYDVEEAYLDGLNDMKKMLDLRKSDV
jgi:hypothetical protein